MLADVPWSWAFSLSSPHGPSGYLVVGAKFPPADGERFLLQVLAQQAAVALANVRLHLREREQAEELRVANLTLRRSMEIHDRLTKVALGGEGQQGIARAAYELTDRPAAIDDRFGNLEAWRVLTVRIPILRMTRISGIGSWAGRWQPRARSGTGSASSRWPGSAEPRWACSSSAILTGRPGIPNGWLSSM